jgi:hypothetical protein
MGRKRKRKDFTEEVRMEHVFRRMYLLGAILSVGAGNQLR